MECVYIYIDLRRILIQSPRRECNVKVFRLIVRERCRRSHLYARMIRFSLLQNTRKYL